MPMLSTPALPPCVGLFPLPHAAAPGNAIAAAAANPTKPLILMVLLKDFSGKAHQVADLVRLVGRCPRLVDDPVDRADAAERNRDQVMESDAGRARHLERATGHNGRIDVEEAVAA